MAEKMAKLATIDGAWKVSVREYPVPHPVEDGLVIKVDAAAICGSDGHFIRMEDPHTPGVVGHEFVGTIVEMGPKANDCLLYTSVTNTSNCMPLIMHEAENRQVSIGRRR